MATSKNAVSDEIVRLETVRLHLISIGDAYKSLCGFDDPDANHVTEKLARHLPMVLGKVRGLSKRIAEVRATQTSE